MRDRSDPVTDEAVASPPRLPSADQPGFYCPHCDYNLKGLTGQVCPECGHSFDPARLQRWATEHKLPLSFRPDAAASSRSSLVFDCLFSPTALGRGLPPFPDPRKAASYGWAMRFGPSLLPSLSAGLLISDGEAVLIGLLASVIGILAGSLLCEAVLATLLGRLVRARAVPPLWNADFWRIMCRCFSGYLLVSCSFAAIAVALILDTDSPLYALSPPLGHWHWWVWLDLLGASLACAIVWWWLALRQAIRARGLPSTGRTVVIWLIPVIAVISSAVGVCAGYMGGWGCTSAMFSLLAI